MVLFGAFSSFAQVTISVKEGNGTWTSSNGNGTWHARWSSSELEGFTFSANANNMQYSNGNIAGCVLENNDQSIIMLSSDRQVRHNVLGELVVPYLTMFATKKTTVVQPQMLISQEKFLMMKR
jgi:hypothetical protein